VNPIFFKDDRSFLQKSPKRDDILQKRPMIVQVSSIIHQMALKFVKISSSISNGLYIKPRATFNEIDYQAESHIESNHPSNDSEVLQSQLIYITWTTYIAESHIE